MVTIFLLLLCFFIIIFFYIRLPKFGKLASGKRKEHIHASPNFREGKFQNVHETPDLTDGATLFSVLGDQLFAKDKNNYPKKKLPTQKTVLLDLYPKENLLVWFGHSSYFLQLDGKKFLVDPVLSGNASPIPGTVKAFKGTSIYTADDIPEIDYLLLTHDHWDHLDYDTLKKIQPRVKKIVTGLGTAAHLEYWGFDTAIIEEKDWNETVAPEEGFTIHTAAARHFSGRTFRRQQSIWLSFVLQTPSFKIFLGGDSGYDTHFKEIGEKYGPFDLALLECGQYNSSWKFIHMLPEQVADAAIDLGANRLMPVHWGKFALAFHAWDEPVKRVVKAAEEKQMPLLIPMIGEKISLDNIPERISRWWLME
ncbi:MBL fold metallo-hydrolase [Ferruginibacter sp. HRS2-29]|uniref:MBL fold metallo-hydrolase n=1 Tax=Ferruginibacter sp. HRS2-29 TaxID=2487334 RepID=UPI0020CFDC78|nr:MBL fold metallo-hydrolase [Ferruginibacter sp. HRS2-29]MCP9750720.1 MBL fold metallo-hydrolase [Ferruginibacter sp. HRS2-29]